MILARKKNEMRFVDGWIRAINVVEIPEPSGIDKFNLKKVNEIIEKFIIVDETLTTHLVVKDVQCQERTTIVSSPEELRGHHRMWRTEKDIFPPLPGVMILSYVSVGYV